MGASLGTLTLDVVAKTGNFIGPLERAERAAAKQAKAVELSQRQAAKAIDNTLQELTDQVALLGKTANEQKLYRLEMQGATQAQLEQAKAAMATIDAFEQQRIASLTGARAMDAAGLSAGQYQQAIRMLPMQLTDVVTSLASGMPLWMVMIQQGGQIRDAFGGIGNAFKALISEIGPAKFVLGGFATTAATLLVAFQQGEDEASEYVKAIALSGNASGVSADQLANLAEAMDAANGTQREAAAALAEVAGAGKFTVDQIQAIAEAALDMQSATGKAVSETVAEFVKLADEPSEAVAALNEDYHFLTASVYEQIRALEEQGDETAAAQLAIETYGNAVQQRAKQVEENLGFLERAWKNIKDGAAEAWDAMLGLGRRDTLEEQLADVEEQMARLQSATGRQASRGRNERLEELSQAREELQLSILERDAEAKREGDRAKANQAAIEAVKEIEKVRDRTMSKTAKRDKERADYLENIENIRAANPFSALLDQQQIDKDLAAIDAKYKETARKTKAYTDDAATRLLQQLREQEASLQEQLSSTVKLTAGQRAQAEWAQQLADLKTKSILTADQKSLLANKDAITAQLAKNTALEAEAQLRERLAEQAQWMATLQERVGNRQNAADIAVLGIGMGDRARQEMEQVNAIQQEYARSREELARQQGTVNGLPEDQFRERIEALRRAEAQEIAIIQDGNRRKLEAQADWANGARAAYKNYLDDARNVAGQTESLLSNAFSGAEDSLVKFVTTGKASFGDLANSILSDLARIAARKSVSSLFDVAGGTSWGSAIASIFQAKGGAWVDGVQAFAKGGAFTNSIVSSPTLFPFAKGTGLMGEAGPEAIMPLTRTADGSLGVRALTEITGTAGGGTPIVINAPVTVQAQPGMSSQEAASQGAQMGQAMTAEIRKNISNELRPGGQIWRAINGR